MPRKKRWFPFNQDFNDDGDLWELTDKFGDRSIRIWMEICAILDKTENRWEMTENGCRAVFRKSRCRLATGWLVIGWLVASRWLAVPQALKDESPVIYGAPNFWKYHPKVESEKYLCDSLLPSFLPSTLKKEQPEPAKPAPSADPKGKESRKLDPVIKAEADPIYQSDPEKFARLIVWIKEKEKRDYPVETITTTLRLFWIQEQRSKVADWWPYINRIFTKEYGRWNEEQAQKHKAEDGRTVAALLQLAGK